MRVDCQNKYVDLNRKWKLTGGENSEAKGRGKTKNESRRKKGEETWESSLLNPEQTTPANAVVGFG